jgi:hypothetical protein
MSLGLVLAAAQLAQADQALDARTLGRVEAIQSFCVQISPQSAKSVEAMSAGLIGQASAEELKNARNSDEYREVYDSTNADLAKVDKEHAADSCSSVAQNQ